MSISKAELLLPVYYLCGQGNKLVIYCQLISMFLLAFRANKMYLHSSICLYKLYGDHLASTRSVSITWDRSIHMQ